MNDHVNSQIPEAEASVYIDDSSQALAERLELCMLRTESFTGESVSQELKSFFDAAFALLRKAAGQDGFSENLKLCKQTKDAIEKLCKLTDSGKTKLCKLAWFWLLELEGLVPLQDGGSLNDLVICWETTLQLLLESEMSFEEQRIPDAKEWKDILYSYVYDYAAGLICEAKERIAQGKPVGTLFVTALTACLAEKKWEAEDFMAACPVQVRLGLEQFLGDRLKARLIELISKTDGGDVHSCPKTDNGDVHSCPKSDNGDVHSQPKSDDGERPSRLKTDDGERPSRLTAHQLKTLTELLKKAGTMTLLALLCLSLTACGGDKEEKQTEETTVAQAQEYPGMVSYQAPDSSEKEYFGVMHATVLDVQEGEKDGLFVYTLRDEEDPENAWCLNSQNVGSIFCDVNGGKRVAVLFYGDIANDPDAVEFVAILDDAPYQIKTVEGTTTQNMMNSFVVRTTKGSNLTFIKDNCKVDKEALSTDGSVSIRVYYADSNSGDLYPVRVYRQPAAKR